MFIPEPFANVLHAKTPSDRCNGRRPCRYNPQRARARSNILLNGGAPEPPRLEGTSGREGRSVRRLRRRDSDLDHHRQFGVPAQRIRQLYLAWAVALWLE